MDIYNPLISVLIPAYNHENYIQETINSIIEQTYKNIELIIVDDGSKDSTWQKIQEMKEVCEKRFVNIHFETKENEGTCKTLNKLLDLSKGEYVYLIASDDKAKPTAVEKEINFLLKNSDYALCVGNNEIIDSDGKRCYWDSSQNIIYDENSASFKTFGEFLQIANKDTPFTSNKFGTYESLNIGNYIPNGYLIRKSIFQLTGYYTPEAPLEDYYLMLQISKYAKMKYIDEILFSYRWHDSNTVKNREKMEAITKTTQIYDDIINEKILKEKKDNILPNVISCMKNGALIKKHGIPFLFMRYTYLKKQKKIKLTKILGITVWKKCSKDSKN